MNNYISKKQRNIALKKYDNEAITIEIMFHADCYRNLKHFHVNYVQKINIELFEKKALKTCA